MSLFISSTVNKHKPWIETTYHGIITENDDKVLLDPPLIALDKDAPLRYAGKRGKIILATVTFPSVVKFTSTLMLLLPSIRLSSGKENVDKCNVVLQDGFMEVFVLFLSLKLF